MQDEIALGFSSEPTPIRAAEALASAVESRLGGPASVGGACLLASAASGDQGLEVGRRLSGRWPEAELIGTSFEGLIAEGRSWQDRPALSILAWGRGDSRPLPLLIEPDEANLERAAEDILEVFPANRVAGRDLLLLFPDAGASPAVEDGIPELLSRIAPTDLAGSAASGPNGAPALAWVDGVPVPGACAGLLFPATSPTADRSETDESPRRRVQVALGSRLASEWMQVSKSRPRWVDELGGRSALPAVEQALSLSARDSLSRLLDRLLVRFRPRPLAPGQDPPKGSEEERYIVGLDDLRGAFSLPIDRLQGGEIALAWPDAEAARGALREAARTLCPGAATLQFACRARGEHLHGDPDLEPAWLAAEAGSRGEGRPVIGTIGPFQLAAQGSGAAPGACARLVHAAVLASI